jgi:KAP family P-loop domain
MASAAPPTTQAPAPSAPDWRTAFLDVLRAQADPTAASSGFAIAVPTTGDLRPLQDLCFDPAQSWVDCLTARYKITAGPFLGTTVAALLADLRALRASTPSDPPPPTLGDLRYRPSGSAWPTLIRSGSLDAVAAMAQTLGDRRTGVVPDEWIASFLAGAANPQVLEPGRALVLFVELDAADATGALYDAERRLLGRLPPRFGIVVSSVPAAVLGAGGELLLPDAGGTAYRRSALRSDRPSRDDRLNVRMYAEALAQFILLPQTAPLTVAVHGPWGKGKSSFMEMMEEALVRDAPATASAEATRTWLPPRRTPLEVLSAVADEVTQASARGAPPDVVRGFEDQLERQWQRVRRTAFDDVVTVRFNAWRYEDSTQIWAGLAAAITRELEGAMTRGRRFLTRFSYAWSQHRGELVRDLGVPLAAVILATVVVAVAGWDDFTSFLRDVRDGNVALAKALTLGGGVAVGVWALAGSFRKALQPVSDRVLTYVRRPDYRDRMGYQHVVLDDVRFVSARLRASRPHTRIVVFIDDLDRCSPEKIMEILQAINLILGESEFFVALGIDTAMIRRAIEKQYREDVAVGALSDFATTYLRKIVQLDFHLPPSVPAQRGSFLATLFSPGAFPPPPETGATAGDGDAAGGVRFDLDVVAPPRRPATLYVEDTPEELQEFLALEDFLADNPRELKRLVNVHRFVKIVLAPAGAAVETPDQRKLVKWLVFCSRWPELVDDVLEQVKKQPHYDDGLSETVSRLPGLQQDTRTELESFAKAGTPVSSADLMREEWLVRAAHLSEFVRFEPAGADVSS